MPCPECKNTCVIMFRGANFSSRVMSVFTTYMGGSPVNLSGIKVTPILVLHRDEFSERVDFNIATHGNVALLIPDVNKWSKLDANIAEMDTEINSALLDATFFGADELPVVICPKFPIRW